MLEISIECSENKQKGTNLQLLPLQWIVNADTQAQLAQTGQSMEQRDAVALH